MKLRTVAFLLFAVGSSAGAYWLGSALGKHRTPPTIHLIDGLAVELAGLDLGEVWERQDFVHLLRIQNQSGVPAEILDFRVSCNCLEVEPRSLAIAAGETATVRLRLDLAYRIPPDIGLAARPFQVDVRPLFKGTTSKQPGWRLHGIIKSPVTLDTLALNFGDATVAGKVPPSRKVRATLHVPDGRLQVTARAAVVKVDVRRCEEGSQVFDVILSPRTGLPVGSFSCKLHFGVVSAAGESFPDVTLPVSGNVQPSVRALPSKLVLGSQPVGQTTEAMVTLQIPEGEDWAVDHIEVESTAVQVDAVPAPGMPSGRGFRVRQRIAREGPQSSVVRFAVRKDGGEPVTLEMSVCYDGDVGGAVWGAGKKGKNP